MYIGVAFAIAAAAMAFALQRRSWPLWLVAAGLFVISLLIAYRFRDPVRPPTPVDAGLDSLEALTVARAAPVRFEHLPAVRRTSDVGRTMTAVQL